MTGVINFHDRWLTKRKAMHAWVVEFVFHESGA
jgi:hypothetical protein